MTCTRCQGLMLKEHMIDMEAGYGEMWSCGWRCVNCGHRDGGVVQQHRQQHARPMVLLPPDAPVRETVKVSLESEPVEPLAA